jgi:hypothetical protein
VAAAERAREKIGKGDMVYPPLPPLDHLSFIPKAGWDQFTLNWKISDDFPPKGNIPNFYQKLIIEDYDETMEKGFATLLFNRQINKKSLKTSIDDLLYYYFELPKKYAQEWREFAEKHSVPFTMGGRTTIPFELAMYYRGVEQIVGDLYKQPEKLKEFCEWLLEYEIMAGLREATIMGAGEVPGAEQVLFQAGIVGPPYVSPKIFEEFVWPTLKKGVDVMVKRGFKSHVHMDGDLTSVLPVIKNLAKGLPKGRLVLDLEKTDMKKAKEILGDKICLYGNVPSSLLVHGTVNDVKKYCKKLIADCAEGGGFILSTECETPWDAKPENVKAIIDSAKEYGKYK